MEVYARDGMTKDRRDARPGNAPGLVCFRTIVRNACFLIVFALILQSKIFNTMKKALKDISPIEWVIFALTAITVILLITGFLCPPPGQIHNSVLIGVGAIFANSALLTALYAIKRGADAKITHGKTTLEITNPDEDGKD